MGKEKHDDSSVGDKLDVLLRLAREANGLSETRVSSDLPLTHKSDITRAKQPNASRPRSLMTSFNFYPTRNLSCESTLSGCDEPAPGA